MLYYTQPAPETPENNIVRVTIKFDVDNWNTSMFIEDPTLVLYIYQIIIVTGRALVGYNFTDIITPESFAGDPPENLLMSQHIVRTNTTIAEFAPISFDLLYDFGIFLIFEYHAYNDTGYIWNKWAGFPDMEFNPYVNLTNFDDAMAAFYLNYSCEIVFTVSDLYKANITEYGFTLFTVIDWEIIDLIL